MQENSKQANIRSNGDYAGKPVPEKLQYEAPAHTDRIVDITIILPLHNEAENIQKVCLELLNVLRPTEYKPTILLVDDGSTDESLEVVIDLSTRHPEISYISFSRNFGKEAAIMAGLNEAGYNFDAVAYMDADGQHDPDDLLKLLGALQESGADLVCGARVDRGYQTRGQRWLTRRFYDIFHILTDQKIEEGVGDFNVLRPQVVEALRNLNEAHPFLKGLVAWVGFRREIVPISIRTRNGGTPKSSTLKMLKLALGAILSFSSWPLRTWSLIGMASAAIAVIYLAIVVAQTALFGRDVPGYATTVVLLLGLGGLQLFSIGVLGEYVSRIYDTSKMRPRYIIRKRG